jgi:hypothetical protein
MHLLNTNIVHHPGACERLLISVISDMHSFVKWQNLLMSTLPFALLKSRAYMTKIGTQSHVLDDTELIRLLHYLSTFTRLGCFAGVTGRSCLIACVWFACSHRHQREQEMRRTDDVRYGGASGGMARKRDGGRCFAL